MTLDLSSGMAVRGSRVKMNCNLCCKIRLTEGNGTGLCIALPASRETTGVRPIEHQLAE